MNLTNLSIAQLKQDYASGQYTPRELITHLRQQAETLQDYNTWLHLMSLEELEPYLAALEQHTPETLALYGVPFAIKDNIDLKAITTTAACPDYAYVAEEDAHVVAQLIAAGAIPLGKTNLDQFATGLVGTRSPYGEVHNSFNRDYISGGSSSGSSVAVAQGLVSFALGTDTAGSGRIPAALNNILGLKPSKGLLSTRGVIPACRSLDCVSLFATTSDDLERVFAVAAHYDAADPFARPNVEENCYPFQGDDSRGFRFAVPDAASLNFFGDADCEAAFYQALDELQAIGGERCEIDFTPFLEAARLLYEGPWVGERYVAIEPLITSHPEALMEVTRTIISKGNQALAIDGFRAQYRLAELKRHCDELMATVDMVVTPTLPSHYTIDEVNADPIRLNANLGYYTNFMNLLDYSAIAVPTGFTPAQLPFGVTLFAAAFADQQLLHFASRLQQHLQLPLGATPWSLPPVTACHHDDPTRVDLVVCGAHMQGLALNHQLSERGAWLRQRTTTAPRYHLYALEGEGPKRPGLIRDESAGVSIEVEVWSLPRKLLGDFMQGIPAPLAIGRVELADGSWQQGFVCEGYIVNSGKNIDHFAGWRAYLAENGG